MMVTGPIIFLSNVLGIANITAVNVAKLAAERVAGVAL
jgi:hypothetical protein